MKNISQAKLAKVPVYVPAVAIQAAFAEQSQRLEALARGLNAAASKAEAMTAALSSEIFEPRHIKGRDNAGSQAREQA